MNKDDQECGTCYHDFSWHTPACEACVDEDVPAEDRCRRFS